MPSTDQARNANSRPDPSGDDMGIARTRSDNVSKYHAVLDTSPEHVHGVDADPSLPPFSFHLSLFNRGLGYEK